jgi:hypothetical protein
MKNNVKVQDDTQSRQSCVSVSVTDLRIGNWIMDRGNKAWQIDCWEHSTKVSAKEPIIEFCDFTKKPIHGHTLTEEVDFLKPIPITEEWLLKLGFVSNPYQDRYEKGDIDVECDKTKGETVLWLAGSPHIKYVHQLQNLFHALNGSDL